MDKAHLWHPFTAMQQWLDESDLEELIIERERALSLSTRAASGS